MRDLIHSSGKIFFATALLLCASAPLISCHDRSQTMRARAEKGDPEAQFNLGFMYLQGKGVGQDDQQAVEWWTKAAEQGYPPAQYNLGWMYLEGEGVTQDNNKAVEWWTKAAEQGVAQAEFELGLMYLNGEGVAQDEHKAVEWVTKAAEQGYAKAQYSLSFAYRQGRGVSQDLVAAHMWANLAAAQEDVGARELQEDLAKHMTPEQIEEAQEKVRKWQEAHQTPSARGDKKP